MGDYEINLEETENLFYETLILQIDNNNTNLIFEEHKKIKINNLNNLNKIEKLDYKNYDSIIINTNMINKNNRKILDSIKNSSNIPIIIYKDSDINKKINKIALKNYILYKIEEYKKIQLLKTNNSIFTDAEDNRFNSIANMSPDGIMTLSIFGYITYINPAFETLTGFSKDEIVGKHMLKIPTMKGRNLKPYLDLVKDFFSGKNTKESFEFPYTRKDGSSGIGDAYINTIMVNGKRELIAIIKDVTDRKIKEEEYEHIFKSSPDGVIHLDLEGNIKNINDVAINLLSLNNSTLLNKNIIDVYEYINPNNQIDFDKIFKNVVDNKKIEEIEVKLNHEKTETWILISIGLIQVYNEKLGIQIIIRDITKQKNYTENLEKLVQERTKQILDNEKLVTAGKISSSITHDLKGPLQTISNSIYLIKLKPEESDKYLDYIEKSIKQANDLLEEFRIQGKETKLNLESIELNELIDESILQINVTENIDFNKIITINKPIMVDKIKMIRVFNNLFKNAIEAMPNGGQIKLLADQVEDKIHISVIDNGHGIPQEALDDIFRPFVTTKEKGMGLGLSFCKNTVEAHGGKIIVNSKQGEGTTFTIVLPSNLQNLQDKNNVAFIKT